MVSIITGADTQSDLPSGSLEEARNGPPDEAHHAHHEETGQYPGGVKPIHNGESPCGFDHEPTDNWQTKCQHHQPPKPPREGVVQLAHFPEQPRRADIAASYAIGNTPDIEGERASRDGVDKQESSESNLDGGNSHDLGNNRDQLRRLPVMWTADTLSGEREKARTEREPLLAALAAVAGLGRSAQGGSGAPRVAGLRGSGEGQGPPPGPADRVSGWAGTPSDAAPLTLSKGTTLRRFQTAERAPTGPSPCGPVGGYGPLPSSPSGRHPEWALARRGEGGETVGRGAGPQARAIPPSAGGLGQSQRPAEATLPTADRAELVGGPLLPTPQGGLVVGRQGPPTREARTGQPGPSLQNSAGEPCQDGARLGSPVEGGLAASTDRRFSRCCSICGGSLHDGRSSRFCSEGEAHAECWELRFEARREQVALVQGEIASVGVVARYLVAQTKYRIPSLLVPPQPSLDVGGGLPPACGLPARPFPMLSIITVIRTNGLGGWDGGGPRPPSGGLGEPGGSEPVEDLSIGHVLHAAEHQQQRQGRFLEIVGQTAGVAAVTAEAGDRLVDSRQGARHVAPDGRYRHRGRVVGPGVVKVRGELEEPSTRGRGERGVARRVRQALAVVGIDTQQPAKPDLRLKGAHVQDR